MVRRIDSFCVLGGGLDGASAAAGPAAAAGAALGLGLLHPLAVGLGGLGGGLVGQAADTGQAVILVAQAHPDQELAVLGAGGQIHIPAAGLGEPAGRKHPALADWAQILFAGHGGQGGALVGEIVVDLAADTAGQFCAVEAVFVAAQGLAVFLRTLAQIQTGADQGGVPCSFAGLP